MQHVILTASQSQGREFVFNVSTEKKKLMYLCNYLKRKPFQGIVLLVGFEVWGCFGDFIHKC